MQAPSTQTEVLDDVKDFLRLLNISKLVLLGNDQIDIHVRVNKVAVSASTNRPFDSANQKMKTSLDFNYIFKLHLPHQAMFLRALKHCFRLKYFGMSWRILICPDPANVFASSEAPLLQAVPTHVEAFGTSTPEKNERTM